MTSIFEAAPQHAPTKAHLANGQLTNGHSTDGPSMSETSNLVPASYILHPSIYNPNPKVVSASGHYMTLENGQTIFDASGGPAATCIGHGNNDVKYAVLRQMDRFSFCHSLSYGNAAAEDLARLVVGSTNGVMVKATIMGSGEHQSRQSRSYSLGKGYSSIDRFGGNRGCHEIGTTVSGRTGPTRSRALYSSKGGLPWDDGWLIRIDGENGHPQAVWTSPAPSCFIRVDTKHLPRYV